MFNFRVKKIKFTGTMKTTEDGKLIPDFKIYLKGGYRSYKDDLEEARQEIAVKANQPIENVKTEEEWIQYGKDMLKKRAERLAEEDKNNSDKSE